MQFFESFAVFNVNRKLSSLESIWIENDGETMPPEYFVNTQPKIFKALSVFFKKNRNVKVVALKIYKVLMPIMIRVKNSFKLKKFFKY